MANFERFKATHEDKIIEEIEKLLSKNPHIKTTEIQNFILDDLSNIIFMVLKQYDDWKNNQ